MADPHDETQPAPLLLSTGPRAWPAWQRALDQVVPAVAAKIGRPEGATRAAIVETLLQTAIVGGAEAACRKLQADVDRNVGEMVGALQAAIDEAAGRDAA